MTMYGTFRAFLHDASAGLISLPAKPKRKLCPCVQELQGAKRELQHAMRELRAAKSRVERLRNACERPESRG